jgi:lysozyme
VLATLNAAIPWWGSLPDQAQRVMANLCFNMGWKTLATFRQFLAAMQAHDWQRAAQELKNSKWWGQVGERGPRIVQRLLACAAPTS